MMEFMWNKVTHGEALCVDVPPVLGGNLHVATIGDRRDGNSISSTVRRPCRSSPHTETAVTQQANTARILWRSRDVVQTHSGQRRSVELSNRDLKRLVPNSSSRGIWATIDSLSTAML